MSARYRTVVTIAEDWVKRGDLREGRPCDIMISTLSYWNGTGWLPVRVDVLDERGECVLTYGECVRKSSRDDVPIEVIHKFREDARAWIIKTDAENPLPRRES